MMAAIDARNELEEDPPMSTIQHRLLVRLWSSCQRSAGGL
jgi:hypothetical protein